MLNQYPLWKYLLILAVVVPGVLYAVPNLYGEDPGVQVVGVRTAKVDADAFKRIESVLASATLPVVRSRLDEKGAQFWFADTETQLRARDSIQQALGTDNYTVALTLLSATPGWLRSLGALPMYLGLDLRGGVHFLMEVDTESAQKRAEERYVEDIRTTLREAKIRYLTVKRQPAGGVEVRFKDADQREAARDALSRSVPALTYAAQERDDGAYLMAVLRPEQLRETLDFALQQNMTALRNRVDELGVAEPVVQQQGERRIVVQLPGVQDTAKAKEILGRTATLEMMMVDEEHDLAAALAGNVPPGSKLFKQRRGGQILLKSQLIYSGDNIVDAAAGLDSRDGGPVVHITLDAQGAAINQRVTGKNIGKRMAVLFVESKSDTKRDAEGRAMLDEGGQEIKIKRRVEEVITAPVIRDQLGKRFQIEGLESIQEARDLALLLRAGALAAPVDIVEERTIGPSLGKDNIEKGSRAAMLGAIATLIFMIVYYKLFGVVANVALLLNAALMIAVMSLIQATLTMPGIAGIVLNIGMAVDANVLIYERIREELRNRNTPQASIHAGFDRAWGTIFDSNITTLIAAIVLFNFGTGPVKGFAVTLSIGILTSMFTAVMVARAIINAVFGGRRLEKVPV